MESLKVVLSFKQAMSTCQSLCRLHSYCVRQVGPSAGILRSDRGMSHMNCWRPATSVRELSTGVQDIGSVHCSVSFAGSAGVFQRKGETERRSVLSVKAAQNSNMKLYFSGQSCCVCKPLLPVKSLQSLQRDKFRLPLNIAERLFSGRTFLVKTTVQSFHTGRSQESEHKTDPPLTLETEDDLDRLTQQVIKKAGEVDVMVGSLPVRQVEQLVLSLHQCGWDATQILSLLSSHPSFLHHRQSLLPIIHLLFDHGFKLQQVMTILHCLPSVVNMSSSKISEVIDALRDVNFREKSIVKMVTRSPGLLLASKTALHQRVMALRHLFKTSDVITLSMSCPQILTDNWKEVQTKFDYVFHEMNVTQKQMVYASLFNHSLMHIKTRHAFLVRAGFFLMAKRREGEKSPNATLDEIIASSDKAFCKKFGFQVAEYRVFCQLFEKEQEAYQDSD